MEEPGKAVNLRVGINCEEKEGRGVEGGEVQTVLRDMGNESGKEGEQMVFRIP